MEGESAYYAVDVEEAAAVLRETPDRVREMLVTGELEGIPPGGTAHGDWKVLLPGTPDVEEPEPAEERLEASAPEEQEEPAHLLPGESPEEFVQPPETPADVDEPPPASDAAVHVADEHHDEYRDENGEDDRGIASDSGWTTTKQAAKVLGVSRRSVQGYVRRGLLAAREEGEGVNKTFLISIDSLNALRDRRNRDAGEAAKFAEASAKEERGENLYANTGEALRHAIERVEARTAEATELRIRLEITEKAESTLRAELEEERRRREAAERERDELRRRLETRAEPRESPPAPTPTPERAEPRPATGAPQTSPQARPQAPQRRRPLWRRVFGG